MGGSFLQAYFHLYYLKMREGDMSSFHSKYQDINVKAILHVGTENGRDYGGKSAALSVLCHIFK